MKLVFHPDTADGSILLLTDLRPGDVAGLRNTIGQLARGERRDARADADLGITGELRLRIEVGERDEGVSGQAPMFHCRLTAITWSQVEGLLDPFVDASDGDRYQWLDESGAISLAISTSGTW